MSSDEAPRGSRVADDERRHDGRDVCPAEIAGDLAGEPRLDVEAADRLLEVAECRLDLDYEQDVERGMKGEDVDPAAVAVLIEADLNSNQPAKARQELRDFLLDCSVCGIDELVESLALPSDLDMKRRPECPDDAIQALQGHAIHPPTLDARHHLAGDASAVAENVLAPPPEETQRAYGAAGIREHRPIVAMSAYRRRTRGLPAVRFHRRCE